LNSKLLTIVTVTKNCVSTIQQTLDSIKKIKKDNIEFVVVDGLSTDGTFELLEQNKFLINKLICEQDTGIYNAMNKGIGIAEGKYLLFINGDDEIISEGFASFFETLSKQEADILCCTTIAYSKTTGFDALIAKPWRLLFYNSVPHPSTFVKSCILKKFGFKENLRIAADYDFFLTSFLLKYEFKILPFSTSFHRRGGASSNVEASRIEIKKIRKERLGIFYYPLNLFNLAYTLIK
jgi:glycosyltransferase involved in cell wall biosynthesis